MLRRIASGAAVAAVCLVTAPSGGQAATDMFWAETKPCLERRNTSIDFGSRPPKKFIYLLAGLPMSNWAHVHIIGKWIEGNSKFRIENLAITLKYKKNGNVDKAHVNAQNIPNATDFPFPANWNFIGSSSNPQGYRQDWTPTLGEIQRAIDFDPIFGTYAGLNSASRRAFNRLLQCFSPVHG